MNQTIDFPWEKIDFGTIKRTKFTKTITSRRSDWRFSKPGLTYLSTLSSPWMWLTHSRGGKTIKVYRHFWESEVSTELISMTTTGEKSEQNCMISSRCNVIFIWQIWILAWNSTKTIKWALYNIANCDLYLVPPTPPPAQFIFNNRLVRFYQVGMDREYVWRYLFVFYVPIVFVL